MSKKSALALHWQIMIALLLALIIGLSVSPSISLFNVSLLSVLTFFGTLFLNALKMLIVPLIVSALISGISGIGTSDGLGQLGIKTVTYYLLTSFIAILIGLVLVNIIQPGVGSVPQGELSSGLISRIEGKGMGDIVEVFLRMVPTNIVAAAAEGQMLGLICRQRL